MFKIRFGREHIWLALILALAGFLSFYAVWNEGYGNSYYAAAVQSMLTSFHNFFFVSYDSGGFVSVDKPPLGLWIQALFVTIFGFRGWSLILPQALAMVASTALIFHLVQRSFGKPAGLISALLFSLTPVVAAVSRTNNLDTILVLFLLLAAWSLILATERGSLKFLLLSVALVGLGFNVKMLQAFGVIPAIFLVYLMSSALKTRQKLVHLSLAIAVLLVVSLSWAVIVDMTPADQRPYVGSSQTNSVLELALGYNGIQRILPGGSAMGTSMPPDLSGENLPDQSGTGSFPGEAAAASEMPSGGGMMGPGGEGGSAGIFRLFNQQMAGQISWLLPLAIIGFISAFLILRKSPDTERKDKLRSLYFWGLWMLPMLIYFSIAGFFHRYYLITLAPPIAALSGIGLTQMWGEYRRSGSYSLLLPLALVVTATIESVILYRYPDYRTWLIPVICTVCFTSAIVLVYVKAAKVEAFSGFVKPLMASGIIVLLIAPAIWSLTPILYHTETTIPYAGPELSTGGFWPGGSGASGQDQVYGMGMPGSMGETSNPGLVSFLLNHTSDERFLVAVPNAMTASGLMLSTGKPVMAVGGFIGSDPILTVENLEDMVSTGEIRYFLTMDMTGFSGFPRPNRTDNVEADPAVDRPQPGELPGNEQNGMPGMPGMGQTDITDWVKAHGTVVSSDEWSGGNVTGAVNVTGIGRQDNMLKLYDLRGENNT